MTQRTIEDQLRAEYFELLSKATLVVQELETEVRFAVLSLSLELSPYERLRVTSRIKECQSAIEALRRRQEGATFDRSLPEQYSLTSLNDLAGVRVLVFPRSRIEEVDSILRGKFASWTSDPVPDPRDNKTPLARKYHGYCSSSETVRGELQIVPLLTGLFWEVEHSALYKPTPELRGIERSLEMRERTGEVLDRLRAFEDEFESLVRQRREIDR